MKRTAWQPQQHVPGVCARHGSVLPAPVAADIVAVARVRCAGAATLAANAMFTPRPVGLARGGTG